MFKDSKFSLLFSGYIKRIIFATIRPILNRTLHSKCLWLIKLRDRTYRFHKRESGIDRIESRCKNRVFKSLRFHWTLQRLFLYHHDTYRNYHHHVSSRFYNLIHQNRNNQWKPPLSRKTKISNCQCFHELFSSLQSWKTFSSRSSKTPRPFDEFLQRYKSD